MARVLPCDHLPVDTGDEAIAMFRTAWCEDFVAGGCGAVIELP